MKSAATLAAVQADFQARLLSDDAHPGLVIYRNNYLSQLVSCLEDTFPATRKALGAAVFDAESAHFTRENPPSSWSLDHYPAGFVDWLANRREAIGPAVDLARIEWAMTQVFVELDSSPIGLADLPSIDWDSIRLSLANTARILRMTSNAAAVWSAFQSEDYSLGLVDDAPSGPVMVWRLNQMCRLRDLDTLEARFLESQDFSFVDLCSAAVASSGETEGIALAGRLLAQWAQEGSVVACA